MEVSSHGLAIFKLPKEIVRRFKLSKWPFSLHSQYFFRIDQNMFYQVKTIGCTLLAFDPFISVRHDITISFAPITEQEFCLMRQFFFTLPHETKFLCCGWYNFFVVTCRTYYMNRPFICMTWGHNKWKIDIFPLFVSGKIKKAAKNVLLWKLISSKLLKS